MKKIAVLVCACTISITNIFAQYSDKIVVKAGQDFMASLAKQIYHFPQFVEGTVVYKDGSLSRAALNYNMLISEMQFIDSKHDTLSIANEQTIDYITIGKDSFFYDKGYLALITGNPTVKLASRQRIKVIDKQKIGAYDQPTSTGSVDSYNSVQSGTRMYKLDIREDIILAKETSLYLGDKFNHFVIANKKNSIKLSSNKQNEVEKYVRENNVDFNKKEDMIKLIGFLESLKRS